MISEIVHVGVTVSDIDRSIAFYRDVVGLEYLGRAVMEGECADRLFGAEGCCVDVAYLRRGNPDCPPLELIHFRGRDSGDVRADLQRRSISEICFVTDDIRAEYERMSALGVEFLSEPQPFDFTAEGFGRSLAVYFRDPDGIIMELVQNL